MGHRLTESLAGPRYGSHAPCGYANTLLGDWAARLFVEQWVTFPRYVLSGGFARAWREAGAGSRLERSRVT